ncbi:MULTISPECIES: gamma-glutamyltransferase [unclassified Pseudoalteromonas]|uniref:gamma-glutamyltransferase n=1 Tax=unclassified Pseudoalteromonas TaxID=194690 RepID=UPI000693F513|nr:MULTISPECIES: gamma-glutamyltransferase [unclassified Pseudoalteromonas]
MKKIITYLFVATLPLSVVAHDVAQKPKREDREPEAATGFDLKKASIGNKFMVAAANPYAVKAGQAILAKGGSAIDAAIAVQAVLTLVEPQSSGIGGGAFIMHFDKKMDHLTTFDGRETAPSKANSELFLDKNGNAVRWIDAVVGGRSVGVPGVLAALAKAHKTKGNLPWNMLFDDAIALAENGFIVSPRLEMLLSKKFNPGVHQMPGTKEYFFPNDQVIKAGTNKKNPELSKFYKQLAKEGVTAFYSGENAKKIAATVQNSKVAPGILTVEDIKQYQAKERQAVCAPYHEYKVCSMGPPSSGGVALLQILRLLEDKNLSQYEVNNVKALHYFTQASRLAFADRDVYMADPDFASIPVNELLAPRYITKRAALITRNDMGKVNAGEPVQNLAYAIDDAYEMPSTSHISIVDAKGNAISMTTSIEMAFGSTLMVNGYLLNNQLTDFALSPKKNGLEVINRVEPNKRPRSSMSPVMVFNKDGSLRLVIGSPGGSRIINYVAQAVIGVLDWGLSAQEAINMPRITNRNRYTSLENNTQLALKAADFENLGHTVKIVDLNSGIHAVELINSKLYGAADPRREGIALSE